MWLRIDSNQDMSLWQATTSNGVVLRVPGKSAPPEWLIEHHAQRYTHQAPECELGARGCRIRMPDEKQWRTYNFTPRVNQSL